jgi:hypothetical protein
VLPLEQRQVAGREPPSEQRSAEQPEYLGESLLHLHPHRAPITATQPTDIRLTDIRATHSRGMDIRATRDTPLILHPQAMDTPGNSGHPADPGNPAPGCQDSPLSSPCRSRLRIPQVWLPSAIEPRRTDHLGSTTLSSLPAEVRPKCTSGSSVSELTAAYVIFAFASSAALRTPCQSRNPVVLSSSSMYRIGPKFVKYRTVSSGKFVMSWMTPLGS